MHSRSRLSLVAISALRIVLRSTSILTACLLALPVLTLADETVHIIPPDFQGDWASLPERCEAGSESYLQLRANMLYFYESRGVVQEVELANTNDIKITAGYTGEGERWQRTTRFVLSPDRRTLTMFLPGGQAVVRVFCPIHPRND